MEDVKLPYWPPNQATGLAADLGFVEGSTKPWDGMLLARG